MKKKPLYKKAFRTFRDTVTLRKLRKWMYRRNRDIKLTPIIRDIEKDLPNNTVLIFQHQSFDANGDKCFNGGAERYVKDLADIMQGMGKITYLIQKGNDKLWQRKVGNLNVIGLPTNDNESYIAAIKMFKKYQFVIYSGCLEWGPKIHPNVMISHGITWDVPNNDILTEKILGILQDVDQFVSVDTNTISWLRTTFAKTLNDKDMNFIPNYVDTGMYKPNPRPNDGKIRIVFPRRASPERGYWLMSAALPPIMEKYPTVDFDFVGFAHGDKIINDIKGLVSKFPGRVNHYVVEPDEMVQVYQNADISLIPTLYSEGTSLSCLEAQACGNIVISTNIGGLPNLIFDGFNGFLINPSAHELMVTLDKVIAYKELRDEVSKNAVSVAQKFDKNIWIERWKNIISKMD